MCPCPVSGLCVLGAVEEALGSALCLSGGGGDWCLKLRPLCIDLDIVVRCCGTQETPPGCYLQ